MLFWDRKMENKIMVRSVLLITGILEALAVEKQLGVTEIAERLDIHKSTVYRFLTSLQTLGYVRQNEENEKYSLSFKVIDLAGHVLSSIDVRQAAQPVMERLSEETNETIHLAALEQSEVIYIDKIDSNQPLRMHSYVGQKIPIHASALGKVLLTFGPEDMRENLLEKGSLKRYTDGSVTEPAELRAEVERIRKQGYAEDREESVPGVRCVAAPILNRDGSIIAAISISLPTQRYNKERMESLQKMIREGARQISERMGFETNANSYPGRT
jgi:IclR family KDG regulon transcriptional repressor